MSRIGTDQDLTIGGTWLDVREGCAVVLLKVDGEWQEAIRMPITMLVEMWATKNGHELVIRDRQSRPRVECSCGFKPLASRDAEDALAEHLALMRIVPA